MSEWKPGTVAMATVRGVTDVLVFRYQWSDAKCSWDSPTRVDDSIVHEDEHVTDVRPLVVLDLKGEAFTVLSENLKRCAEYHEGREHVHTAAGLRDLARQVEAQTSPPKPPEPTGLGAVVENTEGVRFVRTAKPDFPWVRVDRPDENAFHWTEHHSLDGHPPAKVLSAGWSE